MKYLKQYKNCKLFRGVSFNKRNKRYVARIQKDNKPIFLGSFKRLDEAIKARVKAEKKYFKEFRRYE